MWLYVTKSIVESEVKLPQAGSVSTSRHKAEPETVPTENTQQQPKQLTIMWTARTPSQYKQPCCRLLFV